MTVGREAFPLGADRQYPRIVLHMDMDAFYAAVEVRENPALTGLPLIVGYKGPRGVVSTCSYEARKFGVHSAMPSVTAMRLCPEAVWVPGRMDLYVAVSRRILKILDDFSPVVEPLSIDEAFLDLTGIASALPAGARSARAIKDRIRAEERLTASVGVAPTKFLAKLASDLEKPDGLVVFPLEDVPGRLWPLSVEKLWGIGPKSAARLHAALAGSHEIFDRPEARRDRKSTRLNSSHDQISYAVFCLKKKTPQRRRLARKPHTGSRCANRLRPRWECLPLSAGTRRGARARHAPRRGCGTPTETELAAS